MPYFTIPKSGDFLSADLKLDAESKKSLEIGIQESKKNEDYHQSYIGVLDLRTNTLILYPTYEVDDPSKDKNSEVFGERYVVGHTKIHVEVANKVLTNVETLRTEGYLMGFAVTIDKKKDEKEMQISFNGISRSLNSKSFQSSEEYEKYAELKVNELVREAPEKFPLGNFTPARDKLVDPRAYLPTPVLQKISESIHAELNIPIPEAGLAENLPPVAKSYYEIEREFINDEKSAKKIVEISDGLKKLSNAIDENKDKKAIEIIKQIFGDDQVKTSIELLNMRDELGQTPLMMAAEKGNMKIMNLLFKKVHPNDLQKFLMAQNFSNKTVLDFASESYYGGRTNEFLKAKAQSLVKSLEMESKTTIPKSESDLKEVKETEVEQNIHFITNKLITLEQMSEQKELDPRTAKVINAFKSAIKNYLYQDANFDRLVQKMNSAYAALEKGGNTFFKGQGQYLNTLVKLKNDIQQLDSLRGKKNQPGS